MSGFQARSGPSDVVASGTITAFENNPIEILFDALALPLDMTSANQPQTPLPGIELPIPGRFKVIFQFVDEAPAAGANQALATRMESKRKGDEELTLSITFFNFTSTLGTGSSKPIHFAFAAGRNLYLHYRVFGLAGGDKTLQFTIFQSRAADHESGERRGAEPDKEANA